MNCVPARLEDSQVKLPFGAIPIPPGINSKSRDVIAGIRPEHFEDAAIDGRGLRFTAEANIVESMGSELYAYLDLPGARERHTDQLDELAADSGIDEVPGRGTTVVARLDPASQARAGARIELALDSSQVKLFDIASGRSLSVH
jgi:multiple sugar transport system ATP-binding protein